MLLQASKLSLHVANPASLIGGEVPGSVEAREDCESLLKQRTTAIGIINSTLDIPKADDEIRSFHHGLPMVWMTERNA